MNEGRLNAFLAGRGRDGRGRTLAEVAGFDDRAVEATHDFVQWAFPLPDPSAAVPGAPVLGPGEAEGIRADPAARQGVETMLARMARFYAETDGWLVAHDHNHLRITRILAATRALLGPAPATAFHALVLRRNAGAGHPVNRASLAFWARALDPHHS